MLFISSFSNAFQKEILFLSDLKDYMEYIINNSPEGSISIHRRKKGNMYTLRRGGQIHYIQTGDPLLPAYIEKYCAVKIKRAAENALHMLRKAPEDYDPLIITNQLEMLSDYFGPMLPEAFFSSQKTIETWVQNNYEKNDFRREGLIYKTDRGDMVRSKSECIAANALLRLGVFYLYEMKCRLRDGTWIRPDFTILSHVNGKEYYLEICGMMGDPKYVSRLLGKVNEMSHSGIVLGDNLLLMMESETVPFDTFVFENMIRQTVLKPL